MKKILAGCLIVAVIAMLGVGVAAFYVYRAMKPVIDNAANYMDKAREVTRLGETSDQDALRAAPERRADAVTSRSLCGRADARPRRSQ